MGIIIENSQARGFIIVFFHNPSDDQGWDCSLWEEGCSG